MATKDSTPEETTVSAPIQLATAWIQYDVISTVVYHLEDEIRTVSHNALYAYNFQTMRRGLLAHYLKVWSAEVVELRRARGIMTGYRREKAISVVHRPALGQVILLLEIKETDVA